MTERRLFTAVLVAGLALLAAACGGSKGSQVAQLGSTAATSGSSSSAAAQETGMLPFSSCMRSHGVPAFPDPDSSGTLPKRQVAQLAASDPQFVAAHRTCEHLLPNGGQPTQAQVQQAWVDMRSFARCMRSHGVSNWPDPTFTSEHDHRPFFNPPASIDPNAPQITARIRTCQHVLHANNPLVTTQ
jgi:hypothetical protein